MTVATAAGPVLSIAMGIAAMAAPVRFGAQVGLAGFRREYNTQRPHSSLRYLTPAAFAAKRRAELRSAPVHASPSLANPTQTTQHTTQSLKTLV